MRIYLACTVRGDRGALPTLRAILDRLRHHGHDVFTAHLLQDDVDTMEAALSSTAVYERDVEWLNACDVLVAEASGSSYGVGFEVGYVLGRSSQSGQRALLLYDNARRPFISRMISGNTHPNCITSGYSDLAEVLSFIDQHFALARRPERSEFRIRTSEI